MSTEDTPSTPSDVPDEGKPGHVPKAPARKTRPRQSDARRTMIGRTWVAMIVGVVILIMLLIFILQNMTSTRIAFFGWDFSLPLGVAMLFAAIAGMLLTALAGGARIMQLRRAYSRGRVRKR